MSNVESQKGHDIITRGLTKRFDGHKAVDDVTLSVPTGTIFGFIGPSGSGKTVTIRMLTGVYLPSSGSVTVLGETPSRMPRKVREQIGYLPQSFSLFPNLSALENMRFVSSLYGVGPLKRRRRIRETLQLVGLWDSRRKLASQLSGGMQRRLELATALAHQPRLIFLDEPTAGVDPILREQFWQRFRELSAEGRTLFVTTQYVTEAEYCDRVALISDGRIVANDTPAALRKLALGGDAVDVVAGGLSPDTVEALQKMSGVREVEAKGFEQLRIVVESAGSIIPALINTVQSHGGEVRSVDEYQPNFDEVFVRLVERSRGADETVSGGAERR